MTWTRRLRIAAAAAIVAGSAAVLAAAGPAEADNTGGGYAAATPTRVLDTRIGAGAPIGSVPGKSSVAVAVAGRAGVPATGVSAVVLNLTVTAPQSFGYVVAYADGGPAPLASNVNFRPGQTVPNLAVVPVGADGMVRLFNGSYGSVQLVADVSGYYLAGEPFAQGGFAPVAPARLLDTRAGTGAPPGALGGGASLAFPVVGHGIPGSVSAVVLNVTAVSPAAAGFVTAYADGSPLPFASNLNLSRGVTVANLVLAPVGADGKVRLDNGSPGSVQLVADVFGYVTFGDPVRSGGLGVLDPARLLDTRDGTGVPGGIAATLAGGASLAFRVTGRGGVPLSHVSAVVLNLTAVAPASFGYVSAYADATARPGVSSLNLTPGVTTPNLVYAPVGADGMVRLYNGSSGPVDLVADVSGYVLDTDLDVPVVSVSRYVRNLTGTGADAAVMAAEGRADAAAGSTLVLLDIGAQANDKTGVVLTATSIKLTYAQLVSAVNAYLAGFGSVPGATVAVGTSNDASDWTGYPAAERGADWANKVVDQLEPGAGVTVAGADDIEAGFGTGRAADAIAWESAYLAATTATLIFNGSADGCPATYGGRGGCNAAWTQQQYYQLAGGHDPARIHALPQIYLRAQAVQWAAIDDAGGGGIVFAGALTQHAADPTQYRPVEGWAALYHSLSTLVATPVLPAVTDLRADT